MAARILLTPEELESEASSLKQAARNNQDVITRCNQIVTGLLPNWEGQAQTAFRNSFEIKKRAMEQMTNEMNQLADKIIVFAREMRALEQNKTAEANRLANC